MMPDGGSLVYSTPDVYGLDAAACAAAMARPGDWTCPQCSLLVFATRDWCFACGAQRPLYATPAGAVGPFDVDGSGIYEASMRAGQQVHVGGGSPFRPKVEVTHIYEYTHGQGGQGSQDERGGGHGSRGGGHSNRRDFVILDDDIYCSRTVLHNAGLVWPPGLGTPLRAWVRSHYHGKNRWKAFRVEGLPEGGGGGGGGGGEGDAGGQIGGGDGGDGVGEGVGVGGDTVRGEAGEATDTAAAAAATTAVPAADEAAAQQARRSGTAGRAGGGVAPPGDEGQATAPAGISISTTNGGAQQQQGNSAGPNGLTSTATSSMATQAPLGDGVAAVTASMGALSTPSLSSTAIAAADSGEGGGGGGGPAGGDG
eukprot:g2891.t1